MNDTTMWAMGYDNPGGPEVLRRAQVPKPVPLSSDILVKVHAAGVNPVDWRTRAGAPTPAAAAQTPGFHVLGWDVSGVVESIGSGVHLFQPGDEVFGLPWFPRPAGANAEYVAAPSRQFAKKPASLDHTHAAALPLAGLTAWQALTETVTIFPGQRVLIHAAGGGVGHLAVQIAKSFGAYVIGTASESKHEWLRSLGVDELIDHRTTQFETAIAPVDIVVDLVGGFGGSNVPTRSLSVLKNGGVLVRVAPGTPKELLELAAAKNIHVTPEILVEPDGQGLKELSDLVEKGALKVTVEEIFPLSKLADAHRRGETERTSGKLVVLQLG
jgi:NADPH:quinone reductase-like Zn-dependent oxidoreductase